MQFNVPQFIEHEPKVIGPLTFKQFLFLGTALVIGYILYRTVSFYLFLLVTIVLGAIAAALAFLKIGGIPLSTIVVNFLKFIPGPKIYIWEKGKHPEAKAPVAVKESPKPSAKKDIPLKTTRKSRLQDLHTKMETKSK